MAVFYEFKISVADREDIKSSEKLGEMGVKVEPEWRDSLCVINLDKIEGFHPYNETETKILFRNDSVIVFCKYEDLKEILRKHYRVYPERKHLDKKGIDGDTPMSDFDELNEGKI